MVWLTFENVDFSYAAEGREKAVFSNLSFNLNCSLVSLTGPDGAGKTTLLKLLAGILKPTCGKCFIKLNTQNNRPTLGYMSEHLGLYGELSVSENLNFFCAVKDYDPKAHQQELYSLLDKVGLLKFKDYEVNALSGGMKQKLALCCVLAVKPDILILDCPTVGVDPLSRREIWKIIFDYLNNNNAFCIFSTAYLEEAEKAQNCIFLKDGKIIASGEPSKLLTQVQNRVFSLSCTEQYQPLLHFFIAGKDKLNYLSDIFPRMRRIDLLSKKPTDIKSLKQQLQNTLQGISFNVRVRSPFLEDVYIALNEDKTYAHLVLTAKPDKDVRFFIRSAGPEIIKVDKIKKKFRQFTAVHQSTFNVKQGEIFGLLGPNGAGKTTTFRMICALLNPSFGTITINGFNLKKAKSAVRGQIGYVSQKFSLYKKLTLLQNLDYFAGSYGLYGQEKTDRINFLLQDFKLEPFKDILGEDLPFGIQRQLSMACALIHRPQILFLDEATSGADPTARRLFWQRIVELAGQGTSIIVTTHFMEEAEYCDRFLIQDQGRILCLGTPDEICVKNGTRVSIEEAFIERIESFRTHLTGGKT